MKITIYGLPGSGTSSVGKSLSNKLNFDFISSGNIFRQTAKNLNLTLEELTEISKQDRKYDIELDKKIKKIGEDNDNIVVESRLAWYFIKDSFKIMFVSDFEKRVQRIALRENISINQAKEKTIFREKAEKLRYKNYYNLAEIDNKNNFDLIINTTNTTVEEVVNIILEELKI